jgi:predicted homoserine dehydrogenase-like protein
MELIEHLKERQEQGRQIAVGIVGCGQMGSGMVHVTHRMPGMRIRALSDIDLSRAHRTLNALGVPPDMVCTTNRAPEAEDALQAGKYLVTDDALLLTRLEHLEAVVEATGSTEVGAQVAWNCISNCKHVIMLNVETDVTVGVLLGVMARKAGCVYTVASGDEPGVCKGLYDFAITLGFDVSCLGKGKNNVVDYYATPDTCREEATRKRMNPKMLAAFKDGTKTMVEMAAVSNATGLLPDTPGMHGERIDLGDLAKKLVPVEAGGILAHKGCVEYSTGKVAPGVFVVVTTPDPRIREDMKFVSMGDGPYYLFYRPYHLCNIETPISVAEAVLHKTPTLVPRAMHSEVVAVAKRDIAAGDVIGDIGGSDVFHRIYRYDEARALKGIPMGLGLGGRATAAIRKGALLTEDNFMPDPARLSYKLRRMQDEMLAGGATP